MITGTARVARIRRGAWSRLGRALLDKVAQVVPFIHKLEVCSMRSQEPRARTWPRLTASASGVTPEVSTTVTFARLDNTRYSSTGMFPVAAAT